MFWRFGGYANISTLDSILDKPDVTIEELLDESDLIQELKQQNSKLIQYLRDDKILERLLHFVIAPPNPQPRLSPDNDNGGEAEGDEKGGADLGGFFKRRSRSRSLKSESGEGEEGKEEKQRMKYAYVACEILSSEVWSISEALLENQAALRKFWEYLKQPAPLDPVQAGYFTKVNESLLDRKTEEMLEFFKSIDNIIPDMLQHVDCPMVMDLLLKIISLEKAEGGQGIVDWLQQHDLIPTLLSFLSPEHNASTQTSAGDFLKAIITISANATTQDQTVIGPNELTRQLVSDTCIKNLITEMLRGGNPLTVGVGIVIEVIRKNNSDYDMENQTGPVPRSSDPIYLGTLLRQFANHVPDFMTLVHNANDKVVNEDGTTTTKQRELKAAFGGKIEPLGFDRFKTCELMAELLHCSNMALLNERGSEAAVKARDAERERLKAEGKLTSAKESEDPSMLDNEFGTSVDSHGFHHARAPSSESPEEVKKLEVQNNVKDEDFEEVAASEAEPEEKKDGNEKAEIGEPLERSPKLPPRSVESEKESELVEEPLSEKPAAQPKENDEKADSPTSAGLTDKVGDLELEKDDTAMTDSPQPDPEKNEAQSGEADSKQSVSLLTQQLNQSAEANEPSAELSPHPDDKPAPLFSKKPENGETAKKADEAGEVTPIEEEEGSRSILLSEQPGDFSNSQRPQYEVDIDGTPVVGDLLKIMFVEHRVVPTILDFFFRFPWNNFLHNVVYDVVQQVFNGQMERGYNRALAIDLFETGRITERIIEGQQASDKAQAETNMRLGYMGHLTLIAEEVVKFTERHPPELLSLSVLEKVINQQWTDYVEHTLAETRERDNAILGGVRPDMAVGPRQAVLNAVNAASGFGNSSLASAGLGGSGSVGLDSMELTGSGGGYGLSGGSLLSGFNNSSDEEDEDMEEGEGERQATPHVSDSDQPQLGESANSADSPDAGSDASAPAPLQIQPSRARRQFAARLAERKRQQEQQQVQQRQQKGATDAASALSGDWTERYNDPGRFSNLFVGGLSDEESTDDDDDGEELVMKDSFSRRSAGSAAGSGSISGGSASGSVSGDEAEDGGVPSTAAKKPVDGEKQKG